MLKKVSKLVMLVAMLAISTSLFAQNKNVEYPRYGFWSNWGIAITGSFNFQPDVDALPTYPGDYKWGQGFNAGLGINLEQKLNHVFSWRLRYNFPSIFGDCGPQDSALMDRHSALTADLKFSINDAFKGYDPARRASIYLFAGAGLAFSHNQARDFARVGVQLEGGLGFSYRICEHSTIFIEAEADVVGDAPFATKKKPGTDKFYHHHLNYIGTIGYMFNFGVTKADAALAAQRAMLTQEAFDAFEDEVSTLKKDVANAQANAQRLENQVNQLTDENAALREEALTRAQAVSDSLNGVIDQLKNDQLTYYALPFSILFPNDGWQVPDTEMVKIDAIVKIMKDNPDVKLTLVGFCDYSGSDAYNMKLSQKRAEQVKKVMVRKGIDGDRLTVDYKGKSVAFGDINYSINRRVSFYRVIE